MPEIYPELTSCHVCPHDCGVNRHQAKGFCGADDRVKINLAQLHHGEEPVLSGTRGSGTVFFSHCNLRCVFCQNHPISHDGWGNHASEEECVSLLLELQDAGAHNINLVSPTHYSPQLINILTFARGQGLRIPVVWNSNAYEHVETLKRLSGLVDIYLPDFKYAHGLYSKKYSGAADYPQRALDAICEMHVQTGPLILDSAGIATRGVLVRHLVLPHRLAGTRDLLYRLRERIGSDIPLSLMAQYYPTASAVRYPELNRGLTAQEYQEAVETAQDLGFSRVFIQELSSSSDWTPSFKSRGNTLDSQNIHFRGDRKHG